MGAGGFLRNPDGMMSAEDEEIGDLLAEDGVVHFIQIVDEEEIDINPQANLYFRGRELTEILANDSLSEIDNVEFFSETEDDDYADMDENDDGDGDSDYVMSESLSEDEVEDVNDLYDDFERGVESTESDSESD